MWASRSRVVSDDMSDPAIFVFGTPGAWRTYHNRWAASWVADVVGDGPDAIANLETEVAGEEETTHRLYDGEVGLMVDEHAKELVYAGFHGDHAAARDRWAAGGWKLTRVKDLLRAFKARSKPEPEVVV